MATEQPILSAQDSASTETPVDLSVDELDLKIAKHRADAEAAMDRAARITGIPRNAHDETKVVAKDQVFDPYGYAGQYSADAEIAANAAATITANATTATRQETHIMPMDINPSAIPYLILVCLIGILIIAAKLKRISLSKQLTKIYRWIFKDF